MIRKLLILGGILATALTGNAATVSMTPSPISVDQAGAIVSVSFEVAGVSDLHSAEIVVLLLAGVEPVAGSLAAGAFMESNGGSTVVYPEIDGQRISLSQALLGTAHDVDGDGVLGTVNLRIPQIPTSPISIPFESVTLKNTTGTELANLTLEPLQIVSGSVPTLTLRSNVSSIQSAGQTAIIEIYAENVSDLHSYALTMPYSPSALIVLDANEGPFLASGGAQTVFMADDLGNAVEISHAILGVGQDVSGSGVLASVSFQAESLDQLPTTLSLSNVDMIDTFVVNWGPMVIAESLDLLGEAEDSDGDQLLDSWEITHFGAIDDPRAVPTADPDGDGQDNFLEYVAGTDPLDPSSCLNFVVETDPNTSGRMLLHVWPTVAGRNYVIETSDDLEEWGDLVPAAVTNDGDLRTFADDTDGSSPVFYRIRVVLP